MPQKIHERLYELITSNDEISPDAENFKDQPKNFMIHVGTFCLTKISDSLIDPKLILSWLLTVSGTPAFFIGLLVPLREAGALLPQLFSAGYIRSMELRKKAWAFGGFIQAITIGAIGASALLLDGIALGISIVFFLGIFALARSICSVAVKDVMGKTIVKSRRGTASGFAGSIAAGLIILYALLMASNIIDKTTFVIAGLFLAAVFLFIASVLYLRLSEEKDAGLGGTSPIDVVKENFHDIIQDKQLKYFILARGMLVSTALAPPFMVALFTKNMDDIYGGLGFMVLASAIAALISSYIWGRLADRSSRRVLMLSGLFAGLTLAVTVLFSLWGWTSEIWVMPILLFALMIAYQGVRLGRSTHLVDMTTSDKRATYTAFSNTIIGILLILGGGLSLIAQIYSEAILLGVFAIMSLVSILFSYRLDEVQK